MLDIGNDYGGKNKKNFMNARDFANPEIKISSFVLLAIMAIFFISTVFTINVYNQKLKDNYSGIMGTIVNRVIQRDPSLREVVVPLVTKKLSQKEQANGKKLLSQYGVNANLEDSIFPILSINTTNNYRFIVLIFAIITILFFVLNCIQLSFFYKKIRMVTMASKKVIDGDYDIYINEHTEGDWSSLSIAFNTMRKIIQNNMEQLNKEKQLLVDLISDISHQLKTPISSMVVYNDLMLEKEIPQEQQKLFLISTKNQLSKMNWLIKNLLKLAKLDAKAINLEKENQSLNETVESAVNNFIDKASLESINIIYSAQYEVMLVHDRLWLEEALNNIIKNAIEHSNEGGEITVSIVENQIYKRIIVEDTGEGLSSEDLPHIFKRFYKSKTSKNSDSIGIGLALAKSIVESHDGMIEAQSKVGEGTTFIITFLKYFN